MCYYTTLLNLKIQYIRVLKTTHFSSHNSFSQTAVVCNKILSKEYLFIIYIFFANNDVTRYAVVFFC